MTISISSSQQAVLGTALLVLLSVGCGGDDSGEKGPSGDAGATVDASRTLDGAVTIDSGPPGSGDASADIPTFNGCTSADYLDKSSSSASRTIEIASMGLSFTPKCITIAKGQNVTWTGMLTVHPLAPGNALHSDAGTAGSPIVPTSSGTTVSFSFPNAGTFPYYCTVHGFGDGEGMSGSIHVE